MQTQEGWVAIVTPEDQLGASTRTQTGLENPHKLPPVTKLWSPFLIKEHNNEALP